MQPCLPLQFSGRKIISFIFGPKTMAVLGKSGGKCFRLPEQLLLNLISYAITGIVVEAEIRT